MARVVEVRSYQVVELLQRAERRRLERAARRERWRSRVRVLFGARADSPAPFTGER